MNVRRLALLLAALLLLAACGADEQAAGDDAPASEPAAVAASEPAEAAEPAEASEPAEAAAAGGVTIEVSETDLGEILVDGDGMTLYVFDNDSDGQSSCTGDCAANWPPLTDEVAAGAGVDGGLLGMTEREDGTAQATYDDQPLYYFAGDQAAGDTNGQGVGDIWWVIGPDGQKITGDEEAATIQY